MDKTTQLETEYLDCVNQFYKFWKRNIYDWPKHFLNYLSDTPLKKRLSFNPQERIWYLLDNQSGQ